MPRKFDVAVMHDFFVDRLVYAGSIGTLNARIKAKSKSGGGGIHGVRQDDISGGNAVNLAHALARLGLRTLLITHSDRAHQGMLERTFEGLDVELIVKPLPAALTVAIEGEVNVMLGDGRGAAEFGPSMIGSGDWKALRNSKLVCSVNWAANRRGTELLSALRKRLGPEKPIFFDPADFRDRGDEVDELLRLMADRQLVDWVSMNEREGIAAARSLRIDTTDLSRMCMHLARKLAVVFDLHAVRASYTSEGTRVSKVPVDTVAPKRLTGAGDVWDAGAIYGRLMGMDEVARLKFANRAARLYLRSSVPEPPTLAQVRSARS